MSGHRWRYDHGRGMGAMVCTECGETARVGEDGDLVVKVGGVLLKIPPNEECERLTAPERPSPGK